MSGSPCRAVKTVWAAWLEWNRATFNVRTLIGSATMAGASVPGVGATLPPAVKVGLTRARTVAWRARTRGRGDTTGLRVLLYHRVADDDDPLSLAPRRFREQMEHLAAEGYTVIDLATAVAMLDAGEVPPRALGLTFDDGFADVRDEALPVLAEHGFRATVFVTSGVTDGRLRFPWYAGPQPPVLGWDEVVELDRAGHPAVRGPHGVASQPAVRRRRGGARGDHGRAA